MRHLYYSLFASAALFLAPTVASAQCYQNGVPCQTNQVATSGQPAGSIGQQIMGTDGTNNQTILTDTSGRTIVNVNSLPALPTGSNTIGAVNVNGPVATTQSGAWNVGLNAGTNAIGTVGVTALPALPTGSNTIGNISNTSFGISGNLPGFTTTPTFNLGTAPTLTTNDQAAVTTSAPSYTSGNNAALSLTTAGALRVDGSGVTQPVSGTVTANIGTAPNLNVVNLAGSNSIGTVGLNAGTNAIGSITNTSFAATQSGTWNVGLSAGSNAIGTVGVTSLPVLPAGTNSIGLVTGQGAVTTAAPSYTSGNTNSLSLTTAGALRVDGSGVTQTISGNVGVTSLPALPTGTNTIGTVNIGTAPTLTVTNAAGSASIGTVGLNAGTNAIGSITNTTFSATQSGAWSVTNAAGTAIIGNLLRSIAFSESASGLAVSGSFTGQARDAGTLGQASPYNYFTCFAYANVGGTMILQGSNDGSTFFPIVTTSVSAGVPTSSASRIITRYYQCKYNNSTTVQTTFFLNSGFGE